MAGKGGGAWKVAYADFVTAMMAFFLVMWIVAQNKPVKESVAKYFNDPMGTSGKPGCSRDAGAAQGRRCAGQCQDPHAADRQVQGRLRTRHQRFRQENDGSHRTTQPQPRPSRTSRNQ